MIRMFAAVAALAAVPAIAAAQASTSDTSGVTVPSSRPGSYSIVVDVSGKDRATVRQELWNAAETACRRAPLVDDPTKTRAAAYATCVDEAQWKAAAQYEQLLEQQADRGQGAFTSAEHP